VRFTGRAALPSPAVALLPQDTGIERSEIPAFFAHVFQGVVTESSTASEVTRRWKRWTTTMGRVRRRTCSCTTKPDSADISSRSPP